MHNSLMDHINENNLKDETNILKKEEKVDDKSDTNSIVSSNSKVTKEELSFFKEKVLLWLNIDNQIKELSKELSNLRKVKNKELEPFILNFMKEHNLNNLNTQKGKLEYKTTETKKAINKDILEQSLSNYLPTDKIEDAINNIMNNRKVSTKGILKRKK